MASDPPADSTADLLVAGRMRQLSAGTVLDEGVRVVHERYKDLVKPGLILAFVPFVALTYFGVYGLEQEMLKLEELQGPVPTNPFAPLVQMIGHMGMVLLPLSIIARGIAEPLAIGAIVCMSAGVLLGRPVSLKQALRRSLSRWFAIPVMWCVRFVAWYLAAMACYIPGFIVAGLFLVALPAMLLEDERHGPFRALGRSASLTSKRLVPAAIIVFVTGLIESWVVAIANFIPNGVLRSLGAAVLQSTVIALYGATITVFYYSCRSRLENYDLELLADTVAEPLPDAPSEDATVFAPHPA